MDCVEFRYEPPCLEVMSTFSLAARLWELPSIRKEMEKLLLVERPYPPHAKEFRQVTEMVVQYSSALLLPAKLAARLRPVIGIVGEQIYNWVYHATRILGLDYYFSPFHRIYWTPYGTVDEASTLYLNWSEFKRYNSDSDFFSLVGMCGGEQAVNNHPDQKFTFPVAFKKNERQIIFLKEDNSEMVHIPMPCLCHPNFINDRCAAVDSQVHGETPLELFKVCADIGFTQAARHYWNLLSSAEKTDNVERLAEYCLKEKCVRDGRILARRFIVEKNCEIFTFLINQMEPGQRQKFVISNVDVIRSWFSFFWPYTEFEKQLKNLNLDNKIRTRIIDIPDSDEEYEDLDYIRESCPY